MPIDPNILVLARGHLNRAGQDVNNVEVDEDREEEGESLANGLQYEAELDMSKLSLNPDDQAVDTGETSEKEPPPAKRQKVNIDKFEANFERASAHYIVDATRREYERPARCACDLLLATDVGCVLQTVRTIPHILC